MIAKMYTYNIRLFLDIYKRTQLLNVFDQNNKISTYGNLTSNVLSRLVMFYNANIRIFIVLFSLTKLKNKKAFQLMGFF